MHGQKNINLYKLYIRQTDGRTYTETHKLSRACENHVRVYIKKTRQKFSLFLHLPIRPTRNATRTERLRTGLTKTTYF